MSIGNSQTPTGGAYVAPTSEETMWLSKGKGRRRALLRVQSMNGLPVRELTGRDLIISPQDPLLHGRGRLDLGASTLLSETPSAVARRLGAQKGPTVAMSGPGGVGGIGSKAGVDQDGNIIAPGLSPSTTGHQYFNG